MTDPERLDPVVVQVVRLANSREISWGDGIVERLSSRVGDIRTAIVAAAQAIVVDPAELPASGEWKMDELEVSFGITLAAEAGVVLSKASAEATFEVTLRLKRQ